MRNIRPDSALILVDLQNDFLPGGALAVPGGDQVIPIANRLQEQFDLVVATQDWHPANHVSFAANHPGKKAGDEIDLGLHRQKLWPVHCIQNTPGAALAADLDIRRIAHLVKKGSGPLVDSYSAFFDNGHRYGTGLAEYLRDHAIQTVFLAGLATDYCVKATALDAIPLGFRVVVIEDACRGVNVLPGDVERAIAEMRAAGVEVVSESV